MSPTENISRHLFIAGVSGGAVLVLVACSTILAYGRSRTERVLASESAVRRVALQLGLWCLPTLGVLFLFVVGLRGYVQAAVPPAEAMVITANLDGDTWSFDYGEGVLVEDALRIPTGRPTQILLRSKKAETRLALPALHLMLSASPKEEGSVWLIAPAPSDQRFACATCASADKAPRLITLAPADFDKWRDDASGASLPPAEYGQKLYTRSQCLACHSLDGTAVTGPTFKGLFGRKEVLADGKEVVVDAAYLAESILDPTAKLVRGYQPIMPPFRGQLNEKQVAALVAFIEAQKP